MLSWLYPKKLLYRARYVFTVNIFTLQIKRCHRFLVTSISSCRLSWMIVSSTILDQVKRGSLFSVATNCLTRFHELLCGSQTAPSRSCHHYSSSFTRFTFSLCMAAAQPAALYC